MSDKNTTSRHVHNHTGTTSASSGEHTHPLPWERLEQEIAELEAQLAQKRAQLEIFNTPTY